ncbi:hypothetical protein Rs2_24494 [Raphanus sativus]|nr:hypothetical protein Rs2_24494 [Raphanus sativus]
MQERITLSVTFSQYNYNTGTFVLLRQFCTSFHNKWQLWIQRLVEEEDSMSNDREILRATGRVTTRTGFTNDGTQTSSPAGLASESSMKVMERQSDVSFFLQLVRAQSKTLVTMNAAERTTRCGFW